MVNRIFISDSICMPAKVVGLCLMVAIGTVVQAAAAEVETTLDRESVAVGEGALLSLRISGGKAGTPEIPQVENLVIEQRGRNQQISMINGQTTRSLTYSYAVGSHTPGDYQIPAVEVMIDGRKYTTLPLKLKVLPGSATQAPPGMPPNPGGQQATVDEAPDVGGKRFGFLTVSPAASDRPYVYVGEIAPVRIQAWIPADARAQLRSGIQPEGKAFTLHHVSDKPQQEYQTKDGKNYLVVTWFGGISATKAGKYPASLSLDATVSVRDTSTPKPKRRRMGGPFDDPFFDRIFDDMDVPVIQKDVTLKSDDREIEVRPLPSAGRPKGFSGAIGDFKIDAWEMPSEWQTSEPGKVVAKLSGSGNFALMNAPELVPADAWKIYPSKGEFTPGDVASFSGSKVFQFSAYPRKTGAQDVSLALSFFDPSVGAYKTITSPAKKIQVAGQDVVDASPVPAPAAPPPAKEPEKKEGGNLVGQHMSMTPVAALVPLVSRPAFVQLLAIGGGLCLLGGILAWHRARRGDPRRIARAAMEKAIREALKVADRCVVVGDVGGFFVAGRLAIQERLGAMWGQSASAITMAEIHARLPADSPVTRFFREADLHAYSGKPGGQVDPQWRTLLTEALDSLSLSN